MLNPSMRVLNPRMRVLKRVQIQPAGCSSPAPPSVTHSPLRTLPSRLRSHARSAGITAEEAHPFTYTATISFPVLDGTPPVDFATGRLVVPPPPEPAEPAEDGEDATPLPEVEPMRIEWEGSVVRQFVGPVGMAALRAALEEGSPVAAFKVSRVLKNSEGTIDSNAAKYAAIASAAPTALLGTDVLTAEEVARVEPDPDPPAPPATPPEEVGGKGKGKVKGPEPTPVEEEEETHPYEAAGTSLKLSFRLSQPLTPRPPTPPPPPPKVSRRRKGRHAAAGADKRGDALVGCALRRDLPDYGRADQTGG